MDSFNKPHPNSILAKASPQLRLRIKMAQSRDAADRAALERWAKSGFTSGSEDVTVERTLVKGGGE